MITDLNGIASDPFADKIYDICVIGAGIAGITLSLKLSRYLNVLLLEAGGYEYSSESQSVYEGGVVGRDYPDLDVGRLRFFGGTSNHWEGDCCPLDDYDFGAKSFLQHSGWPIRKSDLDPYMKEAESIVDLSDDEDWEKPAGYFENRLRQSSDFRGITYRSSPPTRFGQKYRVDIERRSNLQCFLNANVIELRLVEQLSRIDRAIVCNYSGERFEVKARFFVLATGGIENSRLLLNSNHQLPAGLGNRNGLVGRFFSDHLYDKVADFILDDEASWSKRSDPIGTSFKDRVKDLVCRSEWALDVAGTMKGRRPDCLSKVRHFLSPTPKLLTREKLLNFSLRLRARTPGHGNPLDGKIFIGSEQSPNAFSTLSLDRGVDRFGMRRVKLDWQLVERDLYTLQRGVVRFGEVFAALNLGRLKVPEWLLQNPPAFDGGHGQHHMCTTRMAASPREGVVDANQKVFDTENLYVAGSSVFSTAGHANPTFTIVQMTLRLANHINQIA